MSNPEPTPGMYKIELQPEYSMSDHMWDWRVYSWDNVVDPVAKGSAATRWGALSAAKWTVRKIKRGWTPPGPVTYPEVFWVE